MTVGCSLDIQHRGAGPEIKAIRVQSVEPEMIMMRAMFGYVNQLRSFTQGRAQYTMQFSHYEEVPQNVADEVKAKLA